jgi:hypothetical protein
MRRLTILAVGLVALALAGCGGGGNSASSNTTTTATSSESTTSTTGSETTTEASGSTTPNFASGKCKDLAQSAAKIGQDISASGASGNLQDVAKEFQAFVSIVPSEIKGDVQTIADAFTAYATALKGVNLSSGQTPSASDLQKMQDALKSFDQQKVQAAEQRLEAWTKKNC